VDSSGDGVRPATQGKTSHIIIVTAIIFSRMEILLRQWPISGPTLCRAVPAPRLPGPCTILDSRSSLTLDPSA
jgi:hypothetical protein